MGKKGIIIIVLVVVLLVIGVVVYMMLNTNKKPTETVTEASKTQTGITNLLANTDTKTITSLLGLSRT